MDGGGGVGIGYGKYVWLHVLYVYIRVCIRSGRTAGAIVEVCVVIND